MFSKEFLSLGVLMFEVYMLTWFYDADFVSIFISNSWVCINGTGSWNPLGHIFELANETCRLQIIICLVCYTICLFNCCELLIFETLLWLLLLNSGLFNDLSHRQLFVFTFLSGTSTWTFLPCFNLTWDRRICSTFWRQKVDVSQYVFSYIFGWRKKLGSILLDARCTRNTRFFALRRFGFMIVIWAFRILLITIWGGKYMFI